VATNVIRAIMSPLDRLTPLTAKRPTGHNRPLALQKRLGDRPDIKPRPR
jgi:hypothetical protein